MATTVYLIRHGEINNPKDIAYGSLVDLPLSSAGIEQTKSLAYHLKEKGIVPDAIYSSYHTRAVHSAEIIKNILAPNLSIRQDKRLRDMDHPGLEKYKASQIRTKDIWNHKWPKGSNISIEKRENMIKRLNSVIKDIVRLNEGKKVFVIVHGHPSAFFLWKLLNPKGKKMPLPYDLIKKGIYLEKGEVRKLEFNEDGKVFNYELFKI